MKGKKEDRTGAEMRGFQPPGSHGLGTLWAPEEKEEMPDFY